MVWKTLKWVKNPENNVKNNKCVKTTKKKIELHFNFRKEKKIISKFNYK